MVKLLGVSVADDVFEEIEKGRVEKNISRSEYVEKLIRLGLKHEV